MLKAKHLVQNRKRTYRLYTELGLQVRTKRRKPDGRRSFRFPGKQEQARQDRRDAGSKHQRGAPGDVDVRRITRLRSMACGCGGVQISVRGPLRGLPADSVDTHKK